MGNWIVSTGHFPSIIKHIKHIHTGTHYIMYKFMHCTYLKFKLVKTICLVFRLVT